MITAARVHPIPMIALDKSAIVCAFLSNDKIVAMLFTLRRTKNTNPASKALPPESEEYPVPAFPATFPVMI